MKRFLRSAGGWVLVVALVAFALPLHAQQQAPDEAAEIRQRLTALQERLLAHGAALPEEQKIGAGRYAEAFFLIQKAAAIAAGGGRGLYRALSAEPAVKAAEEAVAALDRPVSKTRRTGFQERAYISEIDGSPQPFFLYVPKGYDPERPWPLLVFLHGYHTALDMLTWRDLMYSPTLEEVCEREGVILLMPFGRGNTEFMGIGESDVLKTLGFVRNEYNVDPRRIILSGASMGGSGAYTIACHHPDLWAGVMAITGRVCYYEWMGIEKDALPRFKQIQMDTDYARDLLGNLQYVPVLIFHGQFDTTLKISQSRMMHRLMLERGQSAEYVEFKGMGHLGTWAAAFTHESFTKMLREARSPEAPKSVRFRTFTAKYPGAYWVSIRGLKQWGEPADVSAQVTGENALTIETRNVAELVLGPGIPGVNDVAEAGLNIVGEPMERRAGAEGTIVLRSPQVAPAPEGLAKTQGLCGPIREVYDAPFVIVFPHEENALTRPDRANAARLAREWMAYAQARPRLLSDDTVGEDVIRKHNLILCGAPETNRVLADIADRLPIRITDKAYVVGEHSFPRANAGLRFVYPNPEAPQRLILVAHGVQWGPELQSNHKLDFLPDYVVYTDETVDDGTWFPTNRPLCAGYFDARWQLSDATMWLGDGGGAPAE